MREELRRPHWLSSALAIAIAVLLAYFMAVFVSFVVNTLADDAIVGLSRTGLSIGALRVPLFYILLLIAVVALAVPYFQRQWDPAIRRFSLFSAVFLVAYVTFQAAGTVDPDIPLNALVRYVIVPLRHAIGTA